MLFWLSWHALMHILEYVQMAGILVYFNDLKTAKEIMECGNPYDQWQCGRRVQGYASDKWNAVCQDVVRRGNMAKVDNVSTLIMLTFWKTLQWFCLMLLLYGSACGLIYDFLLAWDCKESTFCYQILDISFFGPKLAVTGYMVLVLHWLPITVCIHHRVLFQISTVQLGNALKCPLDYNTVFYILISILALGWSSWGCTSSDGLQRHGLRSGCDLQYRLLCILYKALKESDTAYWAQPFIS